MKLLLLSNSDLASNYALNLLLPELQGHSVQLLLSSAVGGVRKRADDIERLRFFEQSLFNELLFPLLDERPCQDAELLSFQGLSKYLQAPPKIENAINSPTSLATIRELDPDLILSLRYGGILKDEVIAIPRHGVINLHSGRLPDYRGVMASFWAMSNGDEQLTATLHYISDGSIDTGGVISEVSVPVDYNSPYLDNVLALYLPGIQLITAAVAALAAGESVLALEQDGEGSYYSYPEQAHIDAFHARGLRLVDEARLFALAKRYRGASLAQA
ncbi:formyl transferase [Halioglobus sp. HI00S01]|uniref:formyl transferase n=1 Tax=Halioglobus sp. HI00S01 TaxID=1822214 RepID=UPI0007C2CEE3|nr:formyl transferase [Halioglobus sp. HI00S01]KZX59202.1 formyl transferase [Halioglobus sp. HI00S01]